MKIIRLLSTCLALTACASQHPAARTSIVAAPPAVRLYTIDCGHVQSSDVGSMADDGSMKGVAREVINPCYLIRHPKGDLLWDTGFSEAMADMPGGMSPKGAPMRMDVPRNSPLNPASSGWHRPTSASCRSRTCISTTRATPTCSPPRSGSWTRTSSRRRTPKQPTGVARSSTTARWNT